jgi:hypothetical protein
MVSWSLELCLELLAAHRPDKDGTCPTCTRLGVGSHGRPVAAPCDVSTQATIRLQQLGAQLPAGAQQATVGGRQGGVAPSP